MLNRFLMDITKGVATVAGAKPPRTLLKNMFYYRALLTVIKLKRELEIPSHKKKSEKIRVWIRKETGERIHWKDRDR